MASRVAVQKTVRHVKPLISQNNEEARSRVFGLYKAWYRQIPYIGKCEIHYFIETAPSHSSMSLILLEFTFSQSLTMKANTNNIPPST